MKDSESFGVNICLKKKSILTGWSVNEMWKLGVRILSQFPVQGLLVKIESEMYWGK